MHGDTREIARRIQRDVEKKRWTERKLKKDAVLHLRIEDDIMNRIKAEAAAREISVSDLVRGYLAERFAGAPAGEGAPEFLLATVAFSDVQIMQDAECAVCGETIARGTTARMACGPPPPARLICAHCQTNLETMLHDQHDADKGEE